MDVAVMVPLYVCSAAVVANGIVGMIMITMEMVSDGGANNEVEAANCICIHC